MGLSFSSVGTKTGSGVTPVAAAARRWASTALGVSSPEAAYAPLRKTPALFESMRRDEWLAPSVHDVVEAARAGEKHPLLRREAEGVYSFDLFTEQFCRALLDEVDNYLASGLPVRRPNSMNNYGLIVNEIGMRPAVTDLQQHVLLPIARVLFPDVGFAFHQHHSFMVRYQNDEDAGLDMHTDDSDVTFNVCLGDVFTGAGLTFCGYVGDPDHRHFDFKYRHVKGRAVVHLGTKRHGADDIQSGTRRNLIIWNHNHVWRASEAYSRRMYNYRKESAPPDAQCLSYTHDKDYAAYKAYTDKTAPHATKAWCPPPQACYDTMGDEMRTTKRGPPAAVRPKEPIDT